MVDETSVQDTGTQDQAPVEQSNDANLATESTESASVEQEVKTEKMLPQSQVSKIAAREARHAAEKTRNELLAQFEREKAQWQQQGQGDQAGSLGGIQQQTPEQIRQMIQEEAYKLSNLAVAQRIETEFRGKIDAAMQSDPEFADLYDALNIEQHPALLVWVNGLENTSSVLKDLAKNPGKYANILMLAQSGSPRLAQIELNKLSKSIKTNETAQSQPKVAEPLDQIKPSKIGGDSGNFEVSDYMKQSWLRV